jgi:small subunit ribosomal protein S21
MLVINVKDKNSLNNALKEYRRKVRDTQLLKELRRRKQFTKPSVNRRHEILNAKYRNERAEEF